MSKFRSLFLSLLFLGCAACGAQTATVPGAGNAPVGLPKLSDVSHWFYYLDVNLEDGTLDRIAASTYDMVVIDTIFTEQNNRDYPIGEAIGRLHAAPHPKLVIAYVDTGEAEDYRTYWKPGWGIGHPDWITAIDPDGWEGNYPVAYWRPEWKAIWLGEGGYLEKIIEAGFDGIYLDWVEAYTDENVMAAAAKDGVDAENEMIRWVKELAEAGRNLKPGFLVIGQNAAELTAHAAYASVIDAVAHEQVWFDGASDNDPPGDCPLPAADEDVDTTSYRNSLSPGCRETYDAYPDSTLHVSTESYVRELVRAKENGLLIFTVDYALQPENVEKAYRESRALGFVPFTSDRNLDQYRPPVP